jgi:hypothetical protein
MMFGLTARGVIDVMESRDQPGHGWTVVLRRQPARIVQGQPEGGYTDSFELVCCDCGDHPDLDYAEAPAELRRVRGPYSVADGIAAYAAHVGLHHQPAGAASPGPGAAPGDGM